MSVRRWDNIARPVLGGIIGAAVAYTLYRACVLRVAYADGYQYLLNARAILGHPVVPYMPVRPPFVTLAQLPAVMIGVARPAGDLARLVAPHLLSAVLSILTAAAVFWCYAGAFDTTASLLGVVLFVTSRYFVRYGAHVMADMPAAGWSAATVGLYMRARARRSTSLSALCGMAFGGALLSKYPMTLLGGALGAAELGYAIRERRFDGAAWARLTLAGVVAVATFAVSYAAIAVAVDPSHPIAQAAGWLDLDAVSLTFAVAYASTHAESWRDYGPMIVYMLSPATLLLAGLGLVGAVARMEPRDVPFLAWLAVVGGGIVILIGHTEARYLLPAIPALLYFAVRGAEYLRGRTRIAGAVLLALVGWAVSNGVLQAMDDRDPVFRSDVERQGALLLLEARGPKGRLLWAGSHFQTFHTRSPAPMREDEFFDVFHFEPASAAYFIDQPIWQLGPRAFAPEVPPAELHDGDAIFKAADQQYETKTLPPGGSAPAEVWKVHRLDFAAANDSSLVAIDDHGASIHLRNVDGRLAMTPEHILGPWDAFLTTTQRDAPEPLGHLELRDGEEIVLGLDADRVTTHLELLQIDRRDILRNEGVVAAPQGAATLAGESRRAQ